MPEITLRLATNGYILTETAEGEIPLEYVFEETEDEGLDSALSKPWLNLLQLIDAIMGPTTTRYSKERVRIDLIPGDKYEVKVKESE